MNLMIVTMIQILDEEQGMKEEGELMIQILVKGQGVRGEGEMMKEEVWEGDREEG